MYHFANAQKRGGDVEYEYEYAYEKEKEKEKEKDQQHRNVISIVSHLISILPTG